MGMIAGLTKFVITQEFSSFIGLFKVGKSKIGILCKINTKVSLWNKGPG